MTTEREERFAHLLQPIRDLAQNWDIDIATCLEDYLVDLDNLTIRTVDGESGLNFAEAALLIQNSSSVYGRKVEHLYALVLRTIEHLTQQKSAAAALAVDSASRKGGGAAGADGDAADNDDGEPEGRERGFLMLDDMVIEGKDIDISMGPRGGSGGGTTGGRGVAGGGRGARGPEGPAGAVAATAASISRPPVFMLQQDHSNSFKMTTCEVHKVGMASGALLIEGGRFFGAGDDGPGFGANLGGGCGFGLEGWRGIAGKPTARSARVSFGVAMALGDGSAAGLGSGGSGGGGDDALGYDDSDGDNDDGAGSSGMELSAFDPIDYGAGQDGAASMAPMAGGPKGGAAATAAAAAKKVENPWAPLDPYDAGKAPARPFRRGRTYRLPPGLIGNGGDTKARRARRKDKAVAAAAVQVPVAAEAANADAGTLGEDEGQGGESSTAVGLTGLAHPEFAYIVQRQRRRRRAVRARQARAGPNPFGRFSLAALPGAYDPPSDGDDNYGGGGDGFGGGGGEAFDAGCGGYDGGGGGYDGGRGGYDGGAGGCGGGGGGGDGMQPVSLEDAFRNAPQTYEDLCRGHIDAFMRGAEQYAQESRLSRRVGDWQRRLAPLLHAQEERGEFDIRRYGEDVLAAIASQLPNAAAAAVGRGPPRPATESDDAPAGCAAGAAAAGSTVPFQSVVAGKERFDVCRIFLASLQLANAGNVVLRHGERADQQEAQPFMLQLVSLDASHGIDHFTVPSAATAAGNGVPDGSNPKNDENDAAAAGALAGDGYGGSSLGRGSEVAVGNGKKPRRKAAAATAVMAAAVAAAETADSDAEVRMEVMSP
ncbi:unnamed protein product [Phaeothamnion confervicola]